MLVSQLKPSAQKWSSRGDSIASKIALSARSVAFQDEREPVRELRHPSEEQAALAREHRACEAALGEPAARVAEGRSRVGPAR